MSDAWRIARVREDKQTAMWNKIMWLQNGENKYESTDNDHPYGIHNDSGDDDDDEDDVDNDGEMWMWIGCGCR
jgi:hypothetical protein